jgi:hypothetical protein
MNVRYRVELSHAERTELRALLSGGQAGGAQAQAGADSALNICCRVVRDMSDAIANWAIAFSLRR